MPATAIRSFALTLLVCGSLGATAQAAADSDRVALDAATQAWVDAFNARDADAMAALATEDVVLLHSAGLKIVAAKMAHLSRGEAEAFYAVHKARPFFKDLVEFMISGPVMIQVLEGEGAIAKNRELMGATDPKKAEKGTIRADFADSIDANAVHGSDAPETAAVEVAFFFPGMNVYSR